ncbi:MAG: hypothetical protein CL933_01815, partial [Deltaproteobacteria bacterium]|nr:hypothetical protein [Deltaproteobacteria bacterium]
MLTAILSQYDRQRFAGAVEALVGILEAMETVDYRIIVVDNREERSGSSSITERLYHIGGDNSNREFSAFDRGLSFARSQGFHQEVFLLVTDAYMAYGKGFLELINQDVVQAAIKWQACIGWVDAFPHPVGYFGREYREWIRSSFVFVPAEHVSSIEPLAYPIPAESIFSGEPNQPFVDDSPISERLQRYLCEWLLERDETESELEEGWHSKFKLTGETYPNFEAKVTAILREQLLSVRLREAGVPVFDFRLFPLLAREEGTNPIGLDAPPEEWQWLGWQQASSPPPVHGAVRGCLDRADFPPQLRRGTEARLKVEGWAVAPTGPEQVQIRVGDWVLSHQQCDLRRDDLADELADTRCGFSVDLPLGDLPLGEHRVRIEWIKAATSRDLGQLQVLASFTFDPKRVFIPDFSGGSEPIPIEITGEVESDLEVEGVRLLVSGKEIESASVLSLRGRKPTGGYLYDARVSGHCL